MCFCVCFGRLALIKRHDLGGESATGGCDNLAPGSRSFIWLGVASCWITVCVAPQTRWVVNIVDKAYQRTMQIVIACLGVGLCWPSVVLQLSSWRSGVGLVVFFLIAGNWGFGLGI